MYCFLNKKLNQSSRRTRLNLELLEDRLVPAVYNVNSTADILSPPPGAVTLRSALNAANQSPGADTINLSIPGTYTGGNFEILASGGNLSIVNTSGGRVAVDGNGFDRVFDVSSTGSTTPVTVTFQGLTIQHGNAPDVGGGLRVSGAANVILNDVIVANNEAATAGGGIYLTGTGTLTINASSAGASAVSNNTSLIAGGGIETVGSGLVQINAGVVITDNSCETTGAGIYLNEDSALLNLTGAQVSNNTSFTGSGGGISLNSSGTVTIVASTFQDNDSGSAGGAVYDTSIMPTLNIATSNFFNNKAAGDGGAIWTADPTTITGSYVVGNVAHGLAGGNTVGSVSFGNGGGLFAQGSSVTITTCTFVSNTASVSGGGVSDHATTLTVTNSVFDHNNSQLVGGGINATSPAPQTVTLTAVTFRGNTALYGGGMDGFGVSAVALTVANCWFLNNMVKANGGAIDGMGGQLVIDDSEFTGNIAGDGGAVFNEEVSPQLTISGSTFNNNQAVDDGGALSIGVNVANAMDSQLTNDTFTANTAGNSGGGIFYLGNHLALLNDTINANSAQLGGGVSLGGDPTQVSFQNTIVAQNTIASGVGPDLLSVNPGLIVDTGGNLIGTLTNIGFGKGSRTGNPQLGPLQDNGGKFAGAPNDRQIIQTEALLPGSLAFGIGVAAGAPGTDQRGFPRPGGGATSPSSGAYEPQFRGNASVNEVFVESIYEVLLNRPTDPGASGWVNQLNSGVTPANVILAIEGSPEYRFDLIQGLYERFLDRQADPDGLQYFLNQLAAGATVEQVEAALVGSPEYYQIHGGTNDGFLQSLYEDALGRLPDPGGQAGFGQALASGVSRSTVAALVFGSVEFQADLVTTEYQALLGRDFDSGGLTYFLSELQAGTSDQLMMAQLLGSAEAFAKRT